jgi:phage baseplate assembly protein gpV
LRVLDEVARRSGLFMTLRDDVLHLITLAGTGDAIPVAPGGALLDASVSVNADRACQSVSATGWSALRAALHQATAGQGATGQDADAVDMVADCPERMLTDEAADDDAQMEALAQSELDYRRARAVVFTGVAGGNPELRPGARVKLSGVSKQVAGQYVLASVTHSIDRSRGFVSELSSEPPPPPPRSRTAVASWGTVTRVDDPEAMGRVKVALPTMNSIESDWMFVVCPGGGTGKGLIVMPDVDDQVLVLFVDRDAAQGIVLGGLCAGANPPDFGVIDGSIMRYNVCTRGGHKVRLDDQHKLLRVEDASGSFVELAPDKVTLHAQCDLEISAPGHQIVIQGSHIDFRQG